MFKVKIKALLILNLLAGNTTSRKLFRAPLSAISQQ